MCWCGQMLRRHVATGHELTVEQYRARWNLPCEHPMTTQLFGAPIRVCQTAWLGAVVGNPANHRSRSHQKPWQHRNRDLGDEEGRDRR